MHNISVDTLHITQNSFQEKKKSSKQAFPIIYLIYFLCKQII